MSTSNNNLVPNVDTIIAAANALFQDIPGIRRVYKESPNVPPSGDLPCIIPVVEGFKHTAQANGYQRKDYRIIFLLLVAPGGVRDLPSLEKAARPFGDLVADAFFGHVKLGDETIDHAELSDGDYSAIYLSRNPQANQSGQSYVGWTFTLTATLKKEMDQGI